MEREGQAERRIDCTGTRSKGRTIHVARLSLDREQNPSKSSSIYHYYDHQLDMLVIASIIIQIIQDSLSFRLRHILKIVLISFRQSLNNSLTLAPQLHAEQIEVQITRITSISLLPITFNGEKGTHVPKGIST